jgi:hypothetical protein
MFAKGGVDDTAVEEDLGRVGDGIEVFQGLVEFIVVVAGEGGDPRLDFLQWWWLAEWRWAWWAWWGSNGKEGRKERTCFSDIVTEKSQQQPPGLEGGATGRQRASNDEARAGRGRNGEVL